MHRIVDGYNLLFTSGEYGTVKGRNMKGARERLIDDLSRYQRVRGHGVTVVFDAQGQVAFKSGGNERGIERRKGINIIFTRRGETADQVVVELANESRGIERVVVSSDNEVVRGSRRRGAVVISSEGFMKKMEEALFEENGDGGEGEKWGEGNYYEGEDGDGGVVLEDKVPPRHRGRREATLGKL